MLVMVLLMLGFQQNSFAQKEKKSKGRANTVAPAIQDSTQQQANATLPAVKDSLRPWETTRITDTTGIDSLATSSAQVDRKKNPLSQVKLSEEGLDSQLDYSAVDSSVYDLENQIVHLYGNAVVKYDEYNLTAGYITFSWESNEVTAQGLRDSTTNKLSQIPVFTDKSQTFEAEHIRFNFKTRKGIVKNVVTKQGSDLYVLGKKAKITSTELDTTREDIVYSQDAIFTTCDHPEPHFGIRSQKQKIIANKIVVVGPSNLELDGVPTPLWLPFGVYPLTQVGSTGLIFPKDIQNDRELGFGLKGVGWFFPLGPYFNLQATADYYVRGTYAINLLSQYRRKYKYNGNLTFNYSSLLSENQFAENERSNPIRLNWSHTMDTKAHPTINFSASVRFATQNYNQTFERAAQRVQENQLSSSITFNKRFINNKNKFTASINMNQNSQNNSVNLDFPNLLFTTGNFKPFKSKSGNSKWYENFNFSYRGETKGSVVTTDSLLFTRQTLEDARFGMKHTVTGGFNANIFNYFNFNISTSFAENIYLESFSQYFDPTVDTIQIWEVLSEGEPAELIRVDTVSYGTVRDSTVKGLTAFHNLKPVTASLNTKVFSTLLFKKGRLRGLRMVTSPNVGVSYTPGYDQFFGMLETTDLRPEENDTIQFNRLQNSIYERPSSPDRNLSMTFGFTGIVEAKLFSKKKDDTRNVKIIESFSFSSRYNFEADSMNLADGTFRARTSILNRAIAFNFNSTLRFYQYDEELKKRVNKLLWKEERRLFEATNTTLTITGNTSIRQFIDAVKRNEKTGKPEPKTLEALLDNFKIRYNLGLRWDKPLGRDTFFISTNTIDINGSLEITDNWRIGIGQIGYNFRTKRITYPDFTFSRDLHCWEMAISWRPNANSFTFTLGVKPGTLDFIKVPYQRSNFEGGRPLF